MSFPNIYNNTLVEINPSSPFNSVKIETATKIAKIYNMSTQSIVLQINDCHLWKIKSSS